MIMVYVVVSDANNSKVTEGVHLTLEGAQKGHPTGQVGWTPGPGPNFYWGNGLDLDRSVEITEYELKP